MLSHSRVVFGQLSKKNVILLTVSAPQDVIHVIIKCFLKIFGINWRWFRCHYLGSHLRWWQCRCILPLPCPTTFNSNNTFITTNIIYSHCSSRDPSKKFSVGNFWHISFYARELNLVSRCRQMNKLHCEIIKIRGKYEKKKTNPTIPPSPPTLFTLTLALVTCGKSFQSEICSAFDFYARECQNVGKWVSFIVQS